MLDIGNKVFFIHNKKVCSGIIESNSYYERNEVTGDKDYLPTYLISVRDKNNDVEEYIDIYSQGAVFDTEEELKIAFKTFDSDGDGLINHNDLTKLLEKLCENLSPSEITEMIKVADDANTGKVNFAQFTKMIQVSEQ